MSETDTPAGAPDPAAAARALRFAALLDDPSGCGRFAALIADGESTDPTRSRDEVGGWKLGERIGRGGMGEVYLAERVGGDFRQRAAVKLLAPWVQHPELRARFARERRILARLEHDGIARFLDGGIAADGTPYLALEYVEGRPIVDWCRAHGSSIRERLEIFLGVCDAVEYAHWNLVVHRDLKPSNILVDERGRPKLLDFGIAKLLEEEAPATGIEGAGDADRTTLRALTPRYAAPEQLASGVVTPATDVYALGLVLYELLTDRPPFELPANAAGDPLAMLELRRSGPPPPGLVGGAGRSAAFWRRRPWSVDLDRIALTALASEPERRYRTAGALAEDLRRYLDGRPVRARGDSMLYRTRRFIARNRVAVAAAALVFLELVAGTWIARREARRALATAGLAKLESARSEAALDLLLKLFSRTDPAQAKGRSYSDDELLGLAAEGLERDLADRPELAMPLLHRLAIVRMRRDQRESALALGLRELELQRRYAGPASVGAGRARALVGNILWLLDRPEEARVHLRASFATLEAAGEAATDEAIEALTNLAKVELETGELADAEALARRALKITAAASSEGKSDAALSAAELLPIVLLRQGRDAEALPYAREAAAELRRRSGIEDPQVLIAHANLAILEGNLGNNDRVRAILDEIQPIELRIFGPTRSDTLALLRMRARLDEREGDFAAATATIEAVLATLRSADPPSPSALAWTLTQAASIYRVAGDLATAEERARAAGTAAAVGGVGSQAFWHTALALVLVELRRLDEADEQLAAADAEQHAQKALTGTLRAETLFARGSLELARGRTAEARTHFEAARSLLAASVPFGARFSPLLQKRLATTLEGPERGRRCEMIEEGTLVARRLLGERHPERRELERALQDCRAAE